jgi:hypothetical protein
MQGETIGNEFVRELPVVLTEEEKQSYGKQLAEKVNEQALLEDRKKQANAEWSTKIKKVDIEITRLASARSKGEELRPVKCFERLKGNVVEIVRVDRDEVVESRAAEMRDLQTEFPDISDAGGTPTPSNFNGDEPIGPQTTEENFDARSTEERLADSAAQNDDETPDNVVQGDFGGEVEMVGETVENDTGTAYVSGEQPCAACGNPIADDDKTSMVDGALIHTSCEPSDLTPEERESAKASAEAAKLPTPSFTADSSTLRTEPKTVADKKVRDRSASKKKSKK